MDQWSNTTSDEARQESLQDGKFRTPCCPGIVVKFWYHLVFHIATAGFVIFTSSPAKQRSDDQAPGNWRDPPKTQNINKKRDNDGASGNRLRDLPEWLEEFTENLEDTEVPALAHILMTQIRNVLQKCRQDTHSQDTSVQYSLITARSAHSMRLEWLKFKTKRDLQASLCPKISLVIWCVTCLIHGCSLTRLPPRALPLLHLPVLPHNENTHSIPHISKLTQESLWREDLQSGGNHAHNNSQKKWRPEAPCFLLTSRMIEIAKHACEPR